MAARTQLIAAVPLVVTRAVDGTDVYLYKGQALAAEIPVERREQLLTEGKLVEVEPLEVIVAPEDVEPTETTRPAKNAKLDLWRAYAEQVGVDVTDLKKDEIIAAVEAREAESESGAGDDPDGEDGDPVKAGESGPDPGDPDAPSIV